MPNATLTTSIEIQIRPDLYETIKNAADLQGISVADFALNAIRSAALRMLAQTKL